MISDIENLETLPADRRVVRILHFRPAGKVGMDIDEPPQPDVVVALGEDKGAAIDWQSTKEALKAGEEVDSHT